MISRIYIFVGKMLLFASGEKKWETNRGKRRGRERREEARRRKDDKKISEETGKRAKERRRERGRGERGAQDHRGLDKRNSSRVICVQPAPTHQFTGARGSSERGETQGERKRERERSAYRRAPEREEAILHHGSHPRATSLPLWMSTGSHDLVRSWLTARVVQIRCAKGRKKWFRSLLD